jgi:hypothetical protein
MCLHSNHKGWGNIFTPNLERGSGKLKDLFIFTQEKHNWSRINQCGSQTSTLSHHPTLPKRVEKGESRGSVDKRHKVTLQFCPSDEQ